MDQIQLSKVKLLDSRDWAVWGEQKPENKEEEMKGASARETLTWVLNPSSAPWILALRSAPRPMAPRSAPRSVAPTSVLGSVAPTYLPRQRHLDAPFCPAMHLGAMSYGAETCYLGAVGNGTDPQDPKISLPRGLNINFLKKNGRNTKKSILFSA